MDLKAITEQFQGQAAKLPSIGKSLKLVLDEGVVFVDLRTDTPSISNEDQEADCTITTTADTLLKLRSGELNAMMAVMTGKVKIKGDMGVAMQLQSLLG